MTVNIHKETEFIGIQAIKIANLENVITAIELTTFKTSD